MALMSLRSHSHVKVSMVLMRADHLFIHNYIRLYSKKSYIIYKISCIISKTIKQLREEVPVYLNNAILALYKNAKDK